MAIDPGERGHHLDFDTDTCTKYGMTREEYEDNGKPRCKGKKSVSSNPNRLENGPVRHYRQLRDSGLQSVITAD